MEQEKYFFTYAKEEIKEINDVVCHSAIKRTWILLGVIGVALVMTMVTQQHATTIGILLGFFIMYLALIFGTYRQKKLRLQASLKAAERQYETIVTQDKVIVQVKQGEEELTRYVFPFDEIKYMGETPTICVLQCNGIVFYFHKNMLVENSLLKPFSQVKQPENNAISWVLFFFSFIAVFVAVGVTGFISAMAGTEYPKSMWVFFLFTPVPIASLIYGIVKHKKKNIIAGGILAVLMIFWGCFCFIPF